MRMKKIIISDFQGIIGMHEYDVGENKIFAQIGKNGIGKTSFLNAVRYCLTGQEPQGEMISHGKTSCLVAIEMESETSFTRQKSSSGNKCYINGKPVSATEFNTQISRYVNIPTMRVLTSAEALSSLKPEALEELMLSHGGEFSKGDIMSFINGMTPEKQERLDKVIPDRTLYLRDLAEVYTEFYERRRVLKKSLTEKDAEIKILKRDGLTPPTKTEQELTDELAAALEKQKSASAYQISLRAREQMIRQQKQQEAQIARLTETLSKVVMPDGYAPEKREVAEVELKNSTERRDEAKANITSYTATIQSLTKAIDTLSTPICPLSDKLRCTTDKTPIKKELEEAKANAEASLKMAQETLAKAEKRIAYCQNFINVLNAGKAAEDKKALIQKQIEELKNNPVVVPEEPEKVDASAINQEVDAARKALDAYTRYMRYVEVRRAFMEEKAEYILIDELVASFSAKGEVKERLMEKLLLGYETDMNDIASKLDDGRMKIRLVQQNGIVVCADIRGNGDFIEFKSLSGGEKAKVLYVLMALLSKKSGFRILMLDELSILDVEGLDTLVGTIIAHQDDFDHIFINLVNHIDSKTVLEKYGIAV